MEVLRSTRYAYEACVDFACNSILNELVRMFYLHVLYRLQEILGSERVPFNCEIGTCMT